LTILGLQDAKASSCSSTDALLPALQSILEVFGDLFRHKEQDWTALFEVIKLGLA
jgi:hypothetical protein